MGEECAELGRWWAAWDGKGRRGEISAACNDMDQSEVGEVGKAARGKGMAGREGRAVDRKAGGGRRRWGEAEQRLHRLPKSSRPYQTLFGPLPSVSRSSPCPYVFPVSSPHTPHGPPLGPPLVPPPLHRLRLQERRRRLQAHGRTPVGLRGCAHAHVKG